MFQSTSSNVRTCHVRVAKEGTKENTQRTSDPANPTTATRTRRAGNTDTAVTAAQMAYAFTSGDATMATFCRRLAAVSDIVSKDSPSWSHVVFASCPATPSSAARKAIGSCHEVKPSVEHETRQEGGSHMSAVGREVVKGNRELRRDRMSSVRHGGTMGKQVGVTP